MTFPLDFFNSTLKYFEVEGFSPDVVLLFGVFAILLIFLLVLHQLSRRFQRRGIHPALAATIQTVIDNLPEQDDPLIRQHADNTRVYEEDYACPICMNNPVILPLETNCGHVFCSQCFSLYLNHTQSLHASQCPLCRSRVTLLILMLPREAYRELPNLLHKIDYYNRKFSGEPRTLMEHIYDTPTLLRHLVAAFFSPNMLHYTILARIVMALLAMTIYLISPLDIIPDTLGLFGLIDDVIIILSIVCFVGNMYREYLIQRMYNEVH